MTIRAALYARYSTDKQRKESAEDQLRVCRDLAKREGFKVVETFADEAISGGTTQRPGYQEMLTAARSGKFDVIVAEDTSRLWRNMAEQAPRLAELADLGLHVVTLDVDTRTESAGILGAVKGAMSEEYRREIGRRVRRGLHGLALNKASTGGRAYGYIAAKDAASKTREVNPDQAKVVRQIYSWYAEGKSPRWIANELNGRRVPSPGASWDQSTRARSSGTA